MFKIRNILDLEKRREIIELFINNYADASLTVNFNIDLNFNKQYGDFKLSHILMASVAQSVNSIKQFRYRLKKIDDNYYDICYYPKINLGYSVVNNDSILTHKLMVTDFNGNILKLLDNIEKSISNVQDTFMCERAHEPNMFYMSCIPSLSFTSVINPIPNDQNSCFPLIILGKINNNILPVSVRVHHGLVDGLHISKFQETLNKFLSYNLKNLLYIKLNSLPENQINWNKYIQPITD